MDRYVHHDMPVAHWSPCTATASTLLRAPFGTSVAGISVADAESRRHSTVTREEPASIVFEYDSSPLEISPALAQVLLRILRKAAEQRSIEIDGTVSPPS